MRSNRVGFLVGGAAAALMVTIGVPAIALADDPPSTTDDAVLDVVDSVLGATGTLAPSTTAPSTTARR